MIENSLHKLSNLRTDTGRNRYPACICYQSLNSELFFSKLITSRELKRMIDCHKCEHYYVTWDKEFSHGCGAMGFKSKQFPSIVVRVSSDHECLLNKKKIRN